MIFFIVKKNQNEKGEYAFSNEYKIPNVYIEDKENCIQEDNIQLISWNQAKYNEQEINNVSTLFKTILTVASNDPICQDMNKHFKSLFSKKETKTENYEDNLDLFYNLKKFIDKQEKKSRPEANCESNLDIFFQTVYENWPIPQIVNITESPKIKPQTFSEQYLTNWDNFDAKYISTDTKNKIKNLLDNTSTHKKQSEKDQVRMYKDWTELARAVIGEISFNVSKQSSTSNDGLELQLSNSNKESTDSEFCTSIALPNNKKVTIRLENESEEKKDEESSLYWAVEYAPQDDQGNPNEGVFNVGEFIDSFFKNIPGLSEIKTDSIPLPEFIKKFTIIKFTVTNNLKDESKPTNANQDEQTSNGDSFALKIETNAGNIEFKVQKEPNNDDNPTKSEKNGDSKISSWSITYETKIDDKNDILNFDVLEVPVVGEFVKKIDSQINTKINDFKVIVSYEKANGLSLSFGCNAFGESYNVNIPLSSNQAPQPQQEPQTPQNILLKDDQPSGPVFHGTTVWKKFDKPKKFLILTIPKIGLGLDDDGRIAILLDASLSVSPLTFSLIDAGIGFNINDIKDVKPYLSGFGVSFDNGVLSIGGGFYVSSNNKPNEPPEYIGELAIRFKEIGLTAIGSYQNGSMWAYLALLAPLGGPPAFFVKGLAAGFGYNRRLTLPSIEEVNSYPLIVAATKGFDKKEGDTSDLKEELVNKMTVEKGQYFLAAGIKFTSFKIIDGFLLATVSFGNDCELGLLGLAEVSFPPKVGNNNETKCIAKAQLAIKASLKPAEGVFSAEAQLTNESYILTKECKLTGGFAAYAWFGKNAHSGDFVVTLGGYHPSYNKPSHYPVVPRLGLNWHVNDNIGIVGEVYFALTPSCIMAGGKLSATYTQGDLRAWFVAYADMIIDWKPFHYDVVVGASIGASYTLDLWLIKKTFSIELGANLHLYGPKLRGDVEVSWYIISFTIHFEEGGDDPADQLDWNGFTNSFLVDQSQQSDPGKDILTICFDGIIGKTPSEGIEIISPHQLEISASSKIPIDNASVRPLRDVNGDCNISSSTEFKIEKYNDSGLTEIYVSNKNLAENITSENNQLDFESKKIKQKVPAALWGAGEKQLNESNSVIEHACGEKFSIKAPKITLFPSREDLWIQLEVLAEKNIIPFGNCFTPFNKVPYNLSFEEISIEDFSENETLITSERNIPQKRNDFLKGFKDENENIDISNFAKEAEFWLTESFFAKDIQDNDIEDIWNTKEKGEK